MDPVEEVQEQVEMAPVVDMEALERERARAEANRGAAMLWLEKERAKLVLLQQLPRSVAVVKVGGAVACALLDLYTCYTWLALCLCPLTLECAIRTRIPIHVADLSNL